MGSTRDDGIMMQEVTETTVGGSIGKCMNVSERLLSSKNYPNIDTVELNELNSFQSNEVALDDVSLQDNEMCPPHLVPCIAYRGTSKVYTVVAAWYHIKWEQDALIIGTSDVVYVVILFDMVGYCTVTRSFSEHLSTNHGSWLYPESNPLLISLFGDPPRFL